MEQGSQGAGHKPGVFDPGAAVPRGAGGRFGIPSAMMSHALWVPGFVPCTWRSQPDPWEPRVWSDWEHGHGTDGQGLSPGPEGGGRRVQAHTWGTFGMHDQHA